MALSDAERKAKQRDRDRYVAHQVKITKGQIDRGQIFPDSETLARSKAYAVWRWNGYHDGTVVSL